MKKTEKLYGIIAIIAAIIFIIGAILFFLLENVFLGWFCSVMTFFSLLYSWLFFAMKEDEKNIENLTKDQRKKMYQEMIKRNFNPN